MLRVLESVSLKAYPGQITTLLGSNGAGKSTTLACAQGLMRPDGGSIELLGQDPYGDNPELRARVGVMLQDGGLPRRCGRCRCCAMSLRSTGTRWTSTR